MKKVSNMWIEKNNMERRLNGYENISCGWNEPIAEI